LSESKKADPGSRVYNVRLILSAVTILILVVMGLLMRVPFTGRTAHALGDLVHAPLFGGMTLGALCLLERFRPARGAVASLSVRCLSVSAIVFAFGIAIELAQHRLGRFATVHDAVANGLGIVAASLVYVALDLRRYRPERRSVSRAFLASAGFLLAIAWWSPVMMLRDVVAVRYDFPLLASFESDAEFGRFSFRECKGQLTRRDATDGTYAMEITFQSASHPGATMFDLQPDWSAMKTLEMDVTLDASYTGDSVRFMVKVIDELHRTDHSDTYRGEWALKPDQPQHIRITREEVVDGPDTRQLDLSKIKFVDLLVLEPGETTKIRVDAMRLTL
jgi:hypothetical protein